ncbi:MAG: tartrate-resistant acid phosphatase type 5 family protein [Microscillaceae bacterium]|jgi:predicted phosphodiesterase|nr:tartrate-resistant acid phosphatase type 5 family protein [Microscillaceae bacterium]
MKKIYLFIYILGLGIFAQLPAQTTFNAGYSGGKIKNLLVPKDALNFLAVGDWGRNGEYNQQKVADRMGEASHQLEAEFVVSLGDNFYPNGVASTQDPHWQVSFENVYKAHSLMIDWYSVLGNHDYRGNPQAQIDYSKISRRWQMPARYYSLEKEIPESKEKVLLVFIDTNPFEKKYYEEEKYQNVIGQDTTAQKIWLEKTLAQSTAKWKIVIGHHPLYTSGKRMGKKETEDIRLAFEDLFEKYKVDAYFAGHEHDLQHQKPKSVHYFVSGAGSEIRPTGKAAYTQFSQSMHGFMTVSITDKTLLVQVIDYKGNVIYKTDLNK